MSSLSWPSRKQPEDGFTLIEVLVALGIIFATLLVLAFSMFSSFASVGFSRQRTAASALANQTIEQIRALPLDMLFMSQSDMAGGGDSRITTCSKPSGYCFVATPQREIPVATFGSGIARTPFFNPSAHSPATQPDHVTTQTGSPGTTIYTIRSFVTLDPTDSQTRIATVQVSWSPAQVSGVQSNLQVESKIFTSPFKESPPGATTTTTTPLVHNYTANAQSQPGTITITGTVLNLNAVKVQFGLPTAKAFLSGNSTVGTSTGPAGNLVTGGTASSCIGVLGVCTVSTPAVQATATSPQGSPANGPNNGTQNPTVLGSFPSSLLQGLNLLGSTVTAGIAIGQVSTASALAASNADGSIQNLPIGTGVIPTNNLGYGRATAVQTGALASNLALTLASLPLVNLGLVNLVPTGNANPPGPDMATVNQNGLLGSPTGQTFNASAFKSFTELDVLTGLPIVGTLIRLTAFRAQASACAAPTPSNCAASTASQSGQLSIAGLAPITLAASPNPISIGVPPVNVTTGILNIAVTANVTIGASTIAAPGDAKVNSPLSINVHLGISTLLGTVVDLNIVVDLGTVSTTANYS